MSKKKVRNVALFSLVRKNSLTERERTKRGFYEERETERELEIEVLERETINHLLKREREGESLFSLRERKRVELGFAG